MISEAPKVKTVLNKKKAAFKSRDREAMKAVQQELKNCVKGAKNTYRRKVRTFFKQNSFNTTCLCLLSLSLG